MRQKAPVDLVDDFQVPRHDALEQGHGPFLEGLRQQRVIRVAHRRLRDLPRGVPGQLPLVHQDAHQLGDGQRRMRVVQVNGDLGRKRVEALVIQLIARHEVAHRAGNQEVLLEQAKLLPRRHCVGRIQDFRDGLRRDLLLHRHQIVAGVEDLHVEVVRGAGGEEPEEIHRPASAAGDGNIVRNAKQQPPVEPHRVVGARSVHAVFDPAVDGNETGFFGLLDFPRRAGGQPVVRLFPSDSRRRSPAGTDRTRS